MAELIFAEVGRPPKLLVANKMMLRALGLFDHFMRELVGMHYLLTEPVIMDDAALSELLGGIRKTSHEEGVKRTLAELQGHKQPAA